MAVVAAAVVPHPPIIVPEIGKGEQELLQDTIDAYNKAAKFIASCNPDTIVITSPHSILYSDWFHISPGTGASGDLSQFNTPNVHVVVDYDYELADEISRQAGMQSISAGTQGEQNPELDHGTLIPLLFLSNYCSNCKIVRIGLSGFSMPVHYKFGKCIADAGHALGKKIAVVASGDLSHVLKEDGPYGYKPEGAELDKSITSALQDGDFGSLMNISPALAEAGAECGLRSFVVMSGTLDGKSVESSLLSYQDTFGVGYAVATYKPLEYNPNRHFDKRFMESRHHQIESKRIHEDSFVLLARSAIEEYVKTGEQIDIPACTPTDMQNNKAGVFVSIHKFGELRGCIGTISPVSQNIATEIIRNAIAAATEDPRFDPISEKELPFLEISVDVLEAPEPVVSISELDPKNYGVIVSSGLRRGLLLPDLEGVDTVEKQIEIARYKAGIMEDAEIQMERFKVTRHGVN